MENLDLKELSGYSGTASEENFDNIISYFVEDFTAGYGDFSDKLEDCDDPEFITNSKCPLCIPSQSQNHCCDTHNVVGNQSIDITIR
jgi:hypothetical protein